MVPASNNGPRSLQNVSNNKTLLVVHTIVKKTGTKSIHKIEKFISHCEPYNLLLVGKPFNIKLDVVLF